MIKKTKKVRIAMFSASFLPAIGGQQFLIKYLTESMAKQKAEIFLLSYDQGNRFLKKNQAGFPKYVRLKQKNPTLGLIELYRVIKKINPEVIHIHSAELTAFQISLLKIFRLIKQPFAVTSHGMDVMTQKEIGYGLRLKPINAFFIKFILKRAAKHIIVGKTVRRFALAAGSSPNKVIEINNGVPITDLKISSKKNQEILKKYHISPSDKILLSLSGMRPLKGIEYLIKSMPRILAQFPKAKLLLACNYQSEYGQKINELVGMLNLQKNVKFIGFVTDEAEKIALIRRCDIFCKPSLLEACSVAILEAMQEGKVVVASYPGGIDIITHNRNGLIARVKSSRDYSSKVLQVLKDKNLKRRIENNAKKDIRNFDIQKIAAQYINLFKEIAKS